MSDRKKVLELFEKNKEYMQERINSGIEQNRKGYAEIIVRDKDKKAVPGAKVIIKQKTHEFKYGANLFMLDEFETQEKNKLYRKYFSEAFNIATLPFYWDATEPEKGRTRYAKNSEKMYRRPPIDLCMEFCTNNGIEPREHGLAYEKFFPKWLHKASVREIKLALENRFSEIAKLYKDKIPTIEVTNEMEWREGTTAFYTEPDYIEWCFKLAEKYFPANELVINEYSYLPWTDRCMTTDKYYSYIEANMLKGARIDAIGMQYHMFMRAENEYEETRAYYDPVKLYEHMDLYSRFGKPLQVTEVTIPAYSNSPEDEQMQAEIIEKLYSIWFSHSNVEQIIYWNLPDGYAAFAPQGDMTAGENYFHGGLLRYDMTPKPAYYKIKELFGKKWHTELETGTNEEGQANFKGFYGKYDVEITIGEKTIKQEIDLRKNFGKQFEIIL